MQTTEIGRPEKSEYAPAFERYISRVPETAIFPALEKQIEEVAGFFSHIPEKHEQYRYAEGKWSIREVLGHIIDSERVFGYRALCISRGESVSLPGFDENEYAQNSTVDSAPLKELLQEFEYLRRSHLLFFSHLSQDAWMRIGAANQIDTSVRALAYVMTGHIRHHLHVLKERYLPMLQP